MKTQSIFCLFALLLATGCSTINFHRTGQATTQYEIEEWHHIGMLSLVEFSDAVDLNNRCDGRSWQSVRTERGFLHGLVGVVGGVFYSPMGVEVACR